MSNTRLDSAAISMMAGEITTALELVDKLTDVQPDTRVVLYNYLHAPFAQQCTRHTFTGEEWAAAWRKAAEEFLRHRPASIREWFDEKRTNAYLAALLTSRLDPTDRFILVSAFLGTSK